MHQGASQTAVYPEVSRSARIALAMSGGIDSAMAAVFLQRAGYDVQGLTMRLWQDRSVEVNGTSHDDIASAKHVCERLGISHFTIDLRASFRQDIVEHFINAYAHGRTPNPCVRCNRLIKFGRLLDIALARGYDYLATGHYVRLRRDSDGTYHLLRGVDEEKDQSYFLSQLSQRQLAHALFPLGHYTKEEVHRLADEFLPTVAERSESQDVCFLPSGSYRAFLAKEAPHAIRPGPILNRKGDLLGEHKGLPFYTIGQRKGLGISAPEPLYVLSMDLDRNALVVGYGHELGADTLVAREMRYITGQAPVEGARLKARIRYRARPLDVTVHPLNQGTLHAQFDRSLRDITPGQVLALYDGQEVVGGGTIWCVERSAKGARC